MLLYLAGPMTGIPKFNYPAFKEAAEDLRFEGYEVLSPHEQDSEEVRAAAWASQYGDPIILPSTFTMSSIIRRNVEDVMFCEGLALLPGWTGSAGAVMEEAVMARLNRPSDSVEAWLENRHLA